MNNDDVKRALAQIRDRWTQYALYSSYYSGDHRMAFATDKMKSLFGALFEKFSDNMCPAVVDAMADKLNLTGFGMGDDQKSGGGEGETQIEKVIRETWERNRMDKRVGEVHTEALKSGDAYVIVWPDLDDPGQVTIYPNQADRMTVYYDEERPGVILWAAKAWRTVDDSVRLVMYYPDRIEHYVTLNKKQDFTTLKPESFKAHELGVVRNPYGRVPVFHFANNAPVGHFGISELKPVVPLQDSLNKAITDMLVAMEFVALPQRYIAGIKLDTDPVSGRYIWPFEAGVDRIWSVDDPSAKFGEFPAANLEHFLKVQDNFRGSIARVSRTPLHHLLMMTGEFPSGESLKTAETPFTSKLKDRTVSFGNVWEDVMTFALQIMAVSLGTKRLSAEWKDVEPKSEKDYSETLTIQQNLRPPMLRKLGYSENDIEEITSSAQTVGDAIMDQFTNGAGRAAAKSTNAILPGRQTTGPRGNGTPPNARVRG